MLQIPKLTVSMLGTQGSGKTMYLYGMYAKLSAGESGFFLYADDHDIDLSLAEGWDALTSDGLLPPPTDEKPQRYPFVLNDGFQKILELDWVDYRGGAWMSRVNGSEAADAPAMLQRLENSDSIYLVLDSQYLRDGIHSGNVVSVARELKTGLMTTRLQRAFAARRQRHQPLPSLVVLLTKADVFAQLDANDTYAGSMRRLESVIDQVQQVLPIAFEDDVETLVCPVSIGTLGLDHRQQVNPDAVNPRFVDNPILFTLTHFLRQRRMEIAREASWSRSDLQRRTAEVNALRARLLVRLFRRSRIRAAEAKERDVRYQVGVHETDLNELDRRIEYLAGLMDGTWWFSGGRRA